MLDRFLWILVIGLCSAKDLGNGGRWRANSYAYHTYFLRKRLPTSLEKALTINLWTTLSNRLCYCCVFDSRRWEHSNPNATRRLSDWSLLPNSERFTALIKSVTTKWKLSARQHYFYSTFKLSPITSIFISQCTASMRKFLDFSHRFSFVDSMTHSHSCFSTLMTWTLTSGVTNFLRRGSRSTTTTLHHSPVHAIQWWNAINRQRDRTDHLRYQRSVEHGGRLDSPRSTIVQAKWLGGDFIQIIDEIGRC